MISATKMTMLVTLIMLSIVFSTSNSFAENRLNTDHLEGVQSPLSDISLSQGIVENATYSDSTIFIYGVINISLELNIINCFVFFSKNYYNPNLVTYPSTGLNLEPNATLTLKNSKILNYRITDLYFVNTSINNKINIYNSIIFNNPLSNSIVFLIKNSSELGVYNSEFHNSNELFFIQNVENVSIIQSSFTNVSRNFLFFNEIRNCFLSSNSFTFENNSIFPILQFNSVTNLVVSNNQFYNYSPIPYYMSSLDYFTSFNNIYNLTLVLNSYQGIQLVNELTTITYITIANNSFNSMDTGLFFASSFSNIIIKENKFSNGINAIIVNDFSSVKQLSCLSNNFVDILNPIFINQSNSNQKFVNGNMNYNYYSNFKSIDSNNDGIYDQPYSTIFFIDNHPLKFPFQNYYFYHGLLVIRSNYDVNTFSNSTITHFYDLSWLGITIFYSVLCIGPVVVYGLISKRRVK